MDRKEWINELNHRVMNAIGEYDDFIDLTVDDAKEIIKLLEEQEPRRVKTATNAYGHKFYFCPRCARPIEKSAALGEPRHCEDCGQELIWE